MGRSVWLFSAIGVACFSPSPPTGSPCANGVCPDPLVCSPATGTCEREAVPADGPIDAAIDAPPTTQAFDQLDGAQWLLPCTTGSAGGSGLCPCGSASQMIQLVDAAPAVYSVTVRLRGVSEPGTYQGGSAAGSSGWYVGGSPAGTFLSVFELDVSKPAQHYFVNAAVGSDGGEIEFDYQVALPIASNATLVLSSTGQDGEEERNYDSTTAMPYVIPGVSTTPSPYNGEFFQLDVVSVAPAP